MYRISSADVQNIPAYWISRSPVAIQLFSGKASAIPQYKLRCANSPEEGFVVFVSFHLHSISNNVIM